MIFKDYKRTIIQLYELLFIQPFVKQICIKNLGT